MNEEIREMSDMMAGIIPLDVSQFSSGCTDRLINKYTWCDFELNLNNLPYQGDIAIVVTSYFGQLMWLKPTLTSYRKTGCYVILAYDNSCYIWDNIDDTDYILTRFPRPIHYLLAHSVVVKHKTYEADKRTGWQWDAMYARAIVNNFKNFKYVYITNGDCILEKPEGISKLKEILGDGDLMSGQSTPGGTIHSADMFMTVEAYNKIMDYMVERNGCSVMAGQSAENMIRDAVNTYNLKETFIKYPTMPDGNIDYYCTQNLDSTFKEVIGFRNLYAEFEYRENNGLDPLPAEYMDPFSNWMYFRGEWKKSVCKYYETKDRRYLQMWWDMGKDSWEDRKFLPLEAYGDKPIY